MAHVLAVKPGAVRPAQKKLLEKHGVILIEMDDPSGLKFVRVEDSGIDADSMTWAALAAIDDGNVGSIAQGFVKNIRALAAKKLKARHEATEPKSETNP